MKQIHILTTIFSFLTLFCNPQQKSVLNSSEENRETERVEHLGNRPEDENSDRIRIDDYITFSDSANVKNPLTKFYENRENTMVWIENDELNKYGLDLIRALKSANDEGLLGEYYKLPEIKASIKNLKSSEDISPAALVSLDLMLTNAYLDYASDMSTGRVNPEDLNVVWEVNSEKIDLTNYLEEALKDDEIEGSLIRLQPDHPQYELLVDAYKRLADAKIQGGWTLPGNDITLLKENDSTAQVVKIKRHLFSSGYLPGADSAYIHSSSFDERLSSAVKNFQRDHGLNVDGVVGKETLHEMNQPLEYRLAQLRLNIDRLRWLPDVLGQRDIVVNIPDYKLFYYEDNELMQEMGVIVGETTNYTPALKDTITYIVFNPTWNVPWSIATEEMLPKIRTDSTFLSRNNFRLVRGSYGSDIEVDPDSVDWSDITAENFPFSIIQQPGNTNALGRVKFMLPNNQSIYLHDTPADHLFNRNERDFSHGCVRLERPFQLAETILEGQMTPAEISKTLASRETQNVILDEPVAVHLIYRTAWVDDSGQLQFRDDLYGFDERSMPFMGEIAQPLPQRAISSE